MLININITLIVPDSVDWSDYDLLGCVTGLYLFYFAWLTKSE